MVAIRGLCIRNLKTVAYVLVVGICAYGLCQLLHPIFRQRRVPTQVPGIYNFSGANERNEGELNLTLRYSFCKTNCPNIHIYSNILSCHFLHYSAAVGLGALLSSPT